MLGILPGFYLAPEALAQSLKIPLQLEQAADGVILTINVGINGGPARSYLFDTGSGRFNAFYTSAAAFGGLPSNMASQGLSLKFYATPTSASGLTLMQRRPTAALQILWSMRSTRTTAT